MSGRFDTVAFVTIASVYRSASADTTSRAPSITRTRSQSAIAMSTGPSSDINVSPQSNSTNRMPAPFISLPFVAAT